MEFQAPDRRRLYEQLVQQLRLYIEVNGLQPGARLPSERELAAELRVSRASVRQATIALEVGGLLEVRHGDGIYVRAVNSGPERIGELLRRRDRLPDVHEAREALETMLARKAAERRTDEDIAAMRRALVVMEEEIRAGDIGERGDEMFHAAVTTAAHNPLLAELMNVLREPISDSRTASLSEPGRPLRSLNAHVKILGAIEHVEPRRAEAAMRRHVHVVSDIGLLRWSRPVEHAGPAPAPTDVPAPRRRRPTAGQVTDSTGGGGTGHPPR